MIILAYIVLTFTGIQLIVALVNLLSETIIPPASGVSRSWFQSYIKK